MWLDDCRIPFVDEGDKGSAKPIGKITTGTKENVRFQYTDDKTRIELEDKQNQQGRFTPNLLVCDDVLNDGSVSKSGKNKIKTSDWFNKNAYGKGIGIKAGQNNGEYGDKGSNSRYYDLDLWFDKMIENII